MVKIFFISASGKIKLKKPLCIRILIFFPFPKKTVSISAKRPNIETAKIMETVVLKQISEILHKAAKVSQMSSKGSKTIQIESILFMMKNSPIKIQRLIKYLSAKEFTRKASNDADGEVEENSKKKSITTRCKEFLESIDDTGILLSACSEEYFDEIYMERLLKNDRITRNMDEKRYQERSW